MGKITIGKKEFDVKEDVLDQRELLFYIDNPRVYSILRENGNLDPSQSDIESLMCDKEHVKELKTQIEQNGGLIEPLVVVLRNDDYVVLEGNSRLAAYRILAASNPAKWSMVPVNILPEEITETEIFQLIGTYHLVKKKDWTVYEQAAYVFRQKQLQKCNDDTLAKQVGLSYPTVKKYCEVYQFMTNSGDTIQSHWNFYEQYVTNKGIKKFRDTYLGMDEKVVEEIKTGKIKQAKDIRDKLGKIANEGGKVSKRIMADYINGKVDIDEAYTRFEASGKSGDNFGKVKSFRSLMTSEDFIISLKSEAAGNNAILFELKKIKKELDKLIKDLD